MSSLTDLKQKILDTFPSEQDILDELTAWNNDNFEYADLNDFVYDCFDELPEWLQDEIVDWIKENVRVLYILKDDQRA